MNKNNDLDLKKLPWTGERYLPEMHGSIELEHVHRYLFAKQLAVGKRILDIASGEGYGSKILAETAKRVIGVDIAQDAVSHAIKKYRVDNLEFRLGSCSSIPVEDNSIDMIVSFETIEHHAEHDQMMREFKRILVPNGFVIISSPNKYEYSDRPNYKNPYHIKELYRDEFESLLKTNFKNYKVLDQKVVYGSALFGNDVSEKFTSYKLNDSKISNAFLGLPEPIYLVAIASDSDLPIIQNGLLEVDLWLSEPLKAKDEQIISLNQGINERDAQITNLSQGINERDEQIVSLSQGMHERDAQITNLSQNINERDVQISNLRQGISECNEQITSLSQDLNGRDAQITSLSQDLNERDAQIIILNQTIYEYNQRIEALINSRSWKITKPLRWCGC